MSNYENVTPIYGADSPETAHLVSDYPYGRKLRCKIRYWIECDAKHGFRMVSQTTNPKVAAEVWNAPKKSTYVELAAALYIEPESGHVKWTALGIYSEPDTVIAFVRAFPQADLSRLPMWCRAKAKNAEKFASGERFFSTNGIRHEMSEYEKQRHLDEAAGWRKATETVANALAVQGAGVSA